MIRLCELFAGIGAQATALENLGIEFDATVCEIDDRAYKVYCAIHGNTPNLGDITKVEHLPDCDLVTWSFPCTSLSLAGKQEGMTEGSGTASSLGWEVIRLLRDAKERNALPKHLLMENVPAIDNKKNAPEFAKIRKALEDLGYTNSYQVLNAKDFGVPQNRKRMFMVSSLDGREFIFPQPIPLDKRLKDVLEENVDEKYYLSNEKIAKYQRHKDRHKDAGNGFGWQPKTGNEVSNVVTTHPSKDNTQTLVEIGSLNQGYESSDRVYSFDGISPTITTPTGGGHMPKVEVIEYPSGTTKGYMEAEEGDGLVMERPHKARGTVQKQSVPTLTTGNGCGTGVVVKGDLRMHNYQVDNNVYDDNGVAPTLRAETHGNNPKIEVVPEMEEGDACPMLTPGRDKKRQNGRRFKEPDEPAFTVTTQDQHGVAQIKNDVLRIRYLTERECWRLQGFDDARIDKAFECEKSKTQRYKMAGNSIVVQVLEAIFKGMYISDTYVQPIRKRQYQTKLLSYTHP